MNVWTPPHSDPDILAGNLIRMGALARSMPPAWDGAQVAYLAAGPSGEYFGKMLPGRGLYLNADLHGYGITKSLPHVYEDSVVRKLVDVLRSERGAISTYDGIIAARAGGKAFDIVAGKASITTVALAWTSLFGVSGMPPAGTYTAIPGGAAPTRASTGAWSQGLADPTGGDKKYLLTLGWTSASQINMAILVDLLVAAGTISCNSGSSPYTISTTALTRYTTGAGVMLTFEVMTALSGTADNINVTYTNQGATGSRTTGAIALTTSAIVGRLLPINLGPFIQLQAGDYGVQSVQSLTMSGANTGVLALHLYYPLCFVPGMVANVYAERDSTIQINGLTELVTTAGGALGCLTMYVMPNTTASGILTAYMRTCDG